MKSMKGNKENGFLRIVGGIANNSWVSAISVGLVFWLLPDINFPPYPVLTGIVKIVLTLGMFLFSVCLIMAFINEIRRHRILTPEEKFHSMLPEIKLLSDVFLTNSEFPLFDKFIPFSPKELRAFLRINSLISTVDIPPLDFDAIYKGRNIFPFIIIYLNEIIHCAEEKNLALARRKATKFDFEGMFNGR